MIARLLGCAGEADLLREVRAAERYLAVAPATRRGLGVLVLTCLERELARRRGGEARAAQPVG